MGANCSSLTAPLGPPFTDGNGTSQLWSNGWKGCICDGHASPKRTSSETSEGWCHKVRHSQERIEELSLFVEQESGMVF